VLTPDSPLVSLVQIAFYGGLLAIMVGLPVFIWLLFRALRDLHSIAESLHWISHCTRPQDAGDSAPTATRHDPTAVAPARYVSNSAFGR
jgi:hypothetical protein